MDRELIPSTVLDQVQLCVKIRVLCTEFDPELRPTMDRVYSTLLENHSNSSTLVKEPLSDGSSSSSSTTQNSGESNSHKNFYFQGPFMFNDFLVRIYFQLTKSRLTSSVC
ncbi:hypothetical protein LOK49_LG04G01262 [Camellia lanceoleosa]|uniref:Uncharacterized protein n=1 Tax=Camellia lanceoleosa TaxID=1840588 RepID=A0ACC0I393_9ERIC|nr:hypothetical protein LOK49_LG04G01262 [Camellia lanceoleosa]